MALLNKEKQARHAYSQRPDQMRSWHLLESRAEESECRAEEVELHAGESELRSKEYRRLLEEIELRSKEDRRLWRKVNPVRRNSANDFLKHIKGMLQNVQNERRLFVGGGRVCGISFLFSLLQKQATTGRPYEMRCASKSVEHNCARFFITLLPQSLCGVILICAY